MPYFVYLLLCEDGSLYTGVTTDVARRFAEHKNGIGSNFTRAKKAKRMVYSESQPDRSSAQKREAEIKKWPRGKKLALVSSGIMRDMKKEVKKNNLVIYQAKNGAIELRGDFAHETLWANRMQMAEMFGVNPQAISKHIQNIYNEKELTKKGTSSKMELVQNESGRTVKRQVDIYNLEILIAVGYRINSIVGTKFRQWATKTLREHITKGFTLNRKQIAKNYDVFMKSVSDIQARLSKKSLK